MNREIDEARRAFEADPNVCNERALSLAEARARIKGKPIQLVAAIGSDPNGQSHISLWGYEADAVSTALCGISSLDDRSLISFEAIDCGLCKAIFRQIKSGRRTRRTK